jgi:hypothetical protein
MTSKGSLASTPRGRNIFAKAGVSPPVPDCEGSGVRNRPTLPSPHPSLPPPNPALKRSLDVKRTQRQARIKQLAEEARARQQQRFREEMARRDDLRAAHQRWQEEAEWRDALNALRLQELERARLEEQLRQRTARALLERARQEEEARR